jgi:uncharacterized membrane protein YfhO
MINKLIQLAKKEAIPEIDVSNSVMMKIQTRKNIESTRVSWLPMGLVATISSIAASIIVFFAFNSYRDMNDPYSSFFKPVDISTQMNILYEL